MRLIMEDLLWTWLTRLDPEKKKPISLPLGNDAPPALLLLQAPDPRSVANSSFSLRHTARSL